MTCRLLGLLLFPWTLQLGGGQSVNQTGPPIVVSLANKPISFGCKISYKYTPEFRNFRLSYYYIDRQGQRRPENHVECQPHPGTENQTQTVECPIKPLLPDESATGTYYCSVHFNPSGTRVQGHGTFILVRDLGYQEPAQNFQKPLLFGFTILLTMLSILGTALVFWKKKQIQLPKWQPASSSKQPPPSESESIYTALQRRETEVYAFIESEASSPPSLGNPLSQKTPQGSADEGEFGLVYENL
ncbi:NFAT activation molecule 1 [Rhynchocyon petersi]